MPDYYSTAKQRPHPNSRVAWPFGDGEIRGWYDGERFCARPAGVYWLRLIEPPARWRYLKMDER